MSNKTLGDRRVTRRHIYSVEWRRRLTCNFNRLALKFAALLVYGQLAGSRTEIRCGFARFLHS